MSNNSMKKINSIGGLKAIAMLLLFWWHSTIPSPNTDLGARTCELFFVSSGFLVGYNYYNKNMQGTWKASFEYVLKKLVSFWPLHFLAMMAVMFVCVDPIISKKNLFDAVLNLSLLQAWSPVKEVRYSFNGATWFLSALIFCYFLTPFLIQLITKNRLAFASFIFAVAVRWGLEYISIYHSQEYWVIHIHCSPLIRCLEFYMGMAMVPLFLNIREKTEERKNFWIFTLLEIIAIVGIIYVAIAFNKRWCRTYFALAMCVVIFVFAFDKGMLSKVLASKPFKWFSCIQFEFFILHQATMKCLNRTYIKIMPDWQIMNIAMFVTIILLAVIYKFLLHKKCAWIMQNVINKTMKILQVDIVV